MFVNFICLSVVSTKPLPSIRLSPPAKANAEPLLLDLRFRYSSLRLSRWKFICKVLGKNCIMYI